MTAFLEVEAGPVAAGLRVGQLLPPREVGRKVVGAVDGQRAAAGGGEQGDLERGLAAELTEHPKHPYTQLLLASLPEVGVRFEERRLTGIPGRPPSLLKPPEGCRFRARCPLATDVCKEEPPFVEVEPGRYVACWKVAA